MNMMTSISMADTDTTAVSAAARMGEMLESAIRNGGLLDERRWPAWVDGVQQGIEIGGELVSVELAEEQGLVSRRWFADPFTAVLLIRWHREGLALPPSATPATCLQRWCGRPSGEVGRRLVQKSRDAWAFRLSGLMRAYAAGEVTASSVPADTWRRVLHGLHLDEDRPSIKKRPEARSKAARSDLEERLRDDLAALRAATPSTYAAGRDRARSAKDDARVRLRALPPHQSPISAALRDWALSALSSESGRKSKGYAPSTTRGYLVALASLFADWAGGDPRRANAKSLEDHMMAGIRSTPEERRAELLKAALSFQRFVNHGRALPLLELDLAAWWPEQSSSADILLPEAYERACRRLLRLDEDAALILILMYRAGLRLEEAVGLRVGDVCVHGDRIELIVETNTERSLKTRTSRRIVPLDVLIEPIEREHLLDRLETRAAAPGGAAEPWLIGPPLAFSPPEPEPIGKRVVAAIRSASNSTQLTEHHPRHSFASYLLATLMLPQDVEAPDVPPRLAAVISHERFGRVADRLLGQGRLGGGALHAVSQVMGHTGPGTTVRYYCHLLDLSLGLYCSRPSTLPVADPDWLIATLDVSADARRKAISRVRVVQPRHDPNADYARPTAAAVQAWAPRIQQKIADERLAKAALRRLGRPITREARARTDVRQAAWNADRASDKTGQSSATRDHQQSRPHYVVPWQAIAATLSSGGDGPRSLVAWRQLALKSAPAETSTTNHEARSICRFIDHHLRLNGPPRRREIQALEDVVHRWRRGRGDIRLGRLGDAQAFVSLLRRMGFQSGEILLSLTSHRGARADSEEVHQFLRDRSRLRQMAGRSGWRGSLVVRLKPTGDYRPIVVGRALRFVLIVLLLHCRASS